MALAIVADRAGSPMGQRISDVLSPPQITQAAIFPAAQIRYARCNPGLIFSKMGDRSGNTYEYIRADICRLSLGGGARLASRDIKRLRPGGASMAERW